MKYKYAISSFFMLAILSLSAYADADAGPDQNVRPGATVTLGGSQSTAGTQYSWYQLRRFGPMVELSDAQNDQASFVAPEVRSTTMLVFQLTTVESGGYRTRDLVTIWILPSGPLGETTPPVITLLGENPVTILEGETYMYSDAGAEAMDNVDGNLTAYIDVSNPIDMNTEPGVYEVTYNVSDEAGNEATEVRTVIVSSHPDLNQWRKSRRRN